MRDEPHNSARRRQASNARVMTWTKIVAHVGEHLTLHSRIHGVVVLSSLQQRILRSIEAVSLRIKLHGTAEAKTQLACLGVRWRPGAGDPDWTPAKRAACSRSVTRLERRGLVRRRNWRNPQGRRTTHIALSRRVKRSRTGLPCRRAGMLTVSPATLRVGGVIWRGVSGADPPLGEGAGCIPIALHLGVGRCPRWHAMKRLLIRRELVTLGCLWDGQSND
jgi:hypothetical protein